jgi:DNA-binding NarL/FixJ family response regulator
MPNPNRRVARVLIIDTHPIVREGFRRIIEHEDDLLVCAEADTVSGAHRAIEASNPDVIVADINFKQGDGIDLVRNVRAHYPRLPILVLSTYDEELYAERMLFSGANGYLTKQATGEEILSSLRRVIGGGKYVSETVGANMIRAIASRGRHMRANPIDRLSNRELQVMHLIARGMSTRETGASLHLSIKTIESHRQRIKSKLNLRSGTQLVQYAINWFLAEGTAVVDERAKTAIPPTVAMTS